MTKRQNIVLAGLAPARGAGHSPVQVQKLFFLLDREIPTYIGGPLFDFKAYNYGPFDKRVYAELDALAVDGHVELIPKGKWHEYRLTSAGQAIGDSVLVQLPKVPRDYIETASAFVRSLSFPALVSAIYKAYPDMRANSIFQH
jgi:uncharacterized protein